MVARGFRSSLGDRIEFWGRVPQYVRALPKLDHRRGGFGPQMQSDGRIPLVHCLTTKACEREWLSRQVQIHRFERGPPLATWGIAIVFHWGPHCWLYSKHTTCFDWDLQNLHFSLMSRWLLKVQQPRWSHQVGVGFRHVGDFLASECWCMLRLCVFDLWIVDRDRNYESMSDSIGSRKEEDDRPLIQNSATTNFELKKIICPSHRLSVDYTHYPAMYILFFVWEPT